MSAKKNMRFVIQKHDASHLHYDFRLEMGGVLKSWAIPKKPPTQKGIKRLAVQTQDHSLDYIDFEGTIPSGQYGAGTVNIWDKGTYKLLEKDDEKIEFELHGEQLQGTYVLVQTNYGSSAKQKNWLFMRVDEKGK